MGPGSLLMGIGLMLVVALFVGRPFLKGQLARREALTTRDALLAHKESLLEQIRALDFEHETEKMPGDEYQRQRALLLKEAAATLRELDDLAAGQQDNGATGHIARDVDAAIEAAIAATRQAPETRAPQTKEEGGSAAQIEAAVQHLRSAGPAADGAQAARPQSAGRFCSQCGNPRDAGDKFCAHCGFRFA